MLRDVYFRVCQIVFSLIILIVPASTLAAQQHIVCGEQIQSGAGTITLTPEAWASNVVWGNDNVVWGNGLEDDVVWTDNVVWGNDKVKADNVVWGNGVVTVTLGPDNVVWGNGIEDATDDNVVWGNWVCVGIVAEQ